MTPRSPRLAATGLFVLAAAAAWPQAPPGEPLPQRFTLFGDLRQRADFLDRPANDLLRLRASLRGGVRVRLGAKLDAVVAARANAGSRDPERGTDNEERSGVTVDRAALVWFLPHDGELQVGKGPLALPLSSLVWDEDLRPLGVSGIVRLPVRGLDQVELAAAAFSPSDRLGDETRAAALLARWRWREGAPSGGGVGVGLLRFSRLDRLAATPFARTNRRLGTRFLSDYELVMLDLELRLPVGEAQLLARLDALENLGAAAAKRAERATVSYRREDWGRLELTFVAQRIERDAVLAAYNSDDWWFHSAARGAALFLSRDLGAGWVARASLFRERRDDLRDAFDRLLLDVTASW